MQKHSDTTHTLLFFVITAVIAVTGCASNHVSITETDSSGRVSAHILLYSDAGYANEGQYAVSKAMFKRHGEYPFNFAVSAGDNIQLKTEVFSSRSMLNIWGDGGMSEAFELPFAPLIKSGLRFYATFGNHDHQGLRYYIERDYSDEKNVIKQNTGGFILPDSDYAVQYNGIKIIFLDVATAFSNLNWSDDRETFLREELSKNDSKWIILVFHYPLWSSGEHGKDNELAELQKIIRPYLDEFPVDFVLSGHDHHAELFKYKGKTETRCVIIGNTAKPHDLTNDPNLPSVFKSNSRGFTELDIKENNAELTFRSVDGSILFKEIFKK